MWIRIFPLLAGALAAQHSTTQLGNPYATPDDRLEGAVTYRSQCASCHGADGKGGAAGPDLSRGQFKHAVSDEAMFRVITKGVSGTAMPGFSLNGKAAWQIVTFIRGLNVQAGPATGDRQRGSALFTELKCGGCHTRGAPILNEAAARLTRAELRQALTEPGAQVAPEYWRWRGTLADGSTVEGRRLNEDTFSVQLLTRDGLRTVTRDQIRESELDQRSPMPSFAAKLTGQDLDHMVAYLESLRGDSK
jgi:putative heme-binding domain-containing protein